VRQLAQAPQPGLSIIILNGPEKGTSYKLVAGRITIGRGNDNNIVVKDDNKMSRQHAVVIVTAAGVEVTDISDNNPMLISGRPTKKQLLSPGNIFQLGHTKFQFKQASQTNSLQSFDGGRPQTDRPSRSRRLPQKKTGFYFTVAAVILIFFWLLSSNSPMKKNVDLRTSINADESIDENKKIVEVAEANRLKEGTNSIQYQEAQTNYIKGFRDFRKGQYDRAVESFQACLSLFPKHVQCQRYLRLSQKKFSELVQYHMVLANKYRAQNQFSACKSSYRNVMFMLKYPGDKTYQEAKAGYDACDALEGERF
jgi:pSer/pThr/pTyr-binding forkhead associated (FHA) protein